MSIITFIPTPKFVPIFILILYAYALRCSILSGKESIPLSLRIQLSQMILHLLASFLLLMKMMLISGSVYPELNKQISNLLGVNLSKARISRFADGEVSIYIDENVRGRHVFILQVK